MFQTEKPSSVQHPYSVAFGGSFSHKGRRSRRAFQGKVGVAEAPAPTSYYGTTTIGVWPLPETRS